MKYKISMVFTCLVITLSAFAQQPKPWNENDRKYLAEHLIRTRDSIIAETKDLTEAQWKFKESPGRWSINEIIEHLAIWELLLSREVNLALVAGPQPDLVKNAKQDSAIVNFLMEDKQHISTDYTKPFTFTVPMGINEGKNNLAWLIKMRNESIQFIDSTTRDLRYYFMRAGRGNVHQVYITIFAHTDRHLRQIRKVKLDPKFPFNKT
jgi:hypothetical protein